MLDPEMSLAMIEFNPDIIDDEGETQRGHRSGLRSLRLFTLETSDSHALIGLIAKGCLKMRQIMAP